MILDSLNHVQSDFTYLSLTQNVGHHDIYIFHGVLWIHSSLLFVDLTRLEHNLVGLLVSQSIVFPGKKIVPYHITYCLAYCMYAEALNKR